MSRTKRFLGGIGIGLVSMVVTTVVGIWLARFLLQHWGQHDYGVWLVVGQLLSYLDLIDLGVIGLLGREVAASLGRAGSVEAADEIAPTFGRTLRVLAWQMPVLIALATAMGFLLPAEWAEARRPLVLVLVAYVVFFPFRVAHAVLEGVQALRDIGILNLVSWAVSTLVTVFLTYRGMHVGAAAAAYVARTGFMTVGFVWMLYRSYRRLIPRSLPPVSFAEARAMIRRGGVITVQKLGVIFLNATDNLVVDRGLGAAAVVPYACTNKAYTALENIPRMVLDAARPGLTELRAGAAPEHVVRVTNALTLAALIIGGLFASVTFAVNRGFVLWWVGEAQWAGQATSLLLAIALVFRVWIVALHYTSFAFSLDNHLSVTLILDGIVTVIVSLLLVKPLGYVALPVGSLAGGALVAVPILVPAIARDVKVSIFALLRPVGDWVWRFVPCLVAAHFLTRVWTPTHFVPLVVTSAGATAVYGLVMLPCVMRSSLGGYVRRALGRA